MAMIVLACLMAGPPLGTTTLLKMLAESKDEHARRDAVGHLARIGPPGEGLVGDDDPLVAGLLLALETDPERWVRDEAMDALLGFTRPTPRLMRALGKALRDPEHRDGYGFEVRLGIRTAAVLPALRAAMIGPERPSLQAIRIAGEMGKTALPLVPVLRKLLRHRWRAARYYAASALLRIAPAGLEEQIDAAICEALAKDDEAYAAGDILTHLEHVPIALPRTARMLGKRLAAEPVDDSPSSVINRLDEFGRFAEPATDALEAVLKGQIITAHKAARLLNQCGRTAKAVPYLVSVLKKDWGNAPIPELAYWCLAPAGEGAREAVPLLLRHMKEARGPDRSRAAACLWHLDINLVEKERTIRTRQAALAGLIGMLKSEDEDTRNYAGMRLFYLACPDTVEAVPAMLKQMAVAPFQREYLLSAFGRIGPGAAAALPAVRAALKDKKDAIQEAAGFALIRIAPKDPATVKAILGLHGPLPARQVAKMLGELGPHGKKAVPWLVKNLRDGGHVSAALWKIDPETARKVGAW
ncbi:MAG: hypothetical protein K2W96_14105 [Gemmataceae bacterium]|nr:hypothetical protein [Gemmataceae bacterium]